MATREWNIANTPDLRFRIGSLTKQFTSMLIMQQVAKGPIQLEGRLSHVCRRESIVEYGGPAFFHVFAQAFRPPFCPRCRRLSKRCPIAVVCFEF
ncbi:MAG: serine hydrolase [Candidatus Acidiferrales bacterium]